VAEQAAAAGAEPMVSEEAAAGTSRSPLQEGAEEEFPGAALKGLPCDLPYSVGKQTIGQTQLAWHVEVSQVNSAQGQPDRQVWRALAQ
jgi:hypothetical protein